MKTKILDDFQICISAPLKNAFNQMSNKEVRPAWIGKKRLLFLGGCRNGPMVFNGLMINDWKIITAWKVSKYGVFLVRIFLYSDWIQENANQKKLRIWTLFTQYSLVSYELTAITSKYPVLGIYIKHFWFKKFLILKANTHIDS